MSLNGATDDDCLVLDDTETVTLYPRAANDAFAAAVTVTNALAESVDKSDLSPELLGKAVMDFHLWKSQMTPAQVVPKIRDVVKRSARDNTRWTVVEQVAILDDGARYQCRCLLERT